MAQRSRSIPVEESRVWVERFDRSPYTQRCVLRVAINVCQSPNDNMAFTLWSLFEATLLCLNAVCVLNEERFLAKVGWAPWQNVQGFGEPPTMKSQLMNLVKSIRTVARVPLIFLNILTIIVKLVLG